VQVWRPGQEEVEEKRSGLRWGSFGTIQVGSLCLAIVFELENAEGQKVQFYAAHCNPIHKMANDRATEAVRKHLNHVIEEFDVIMGDLNCCVSKFASCDVHFSELWDIHNPASNIPAAFKSNDKSREGLCLDYIACKEPWMLRTEEERPLHEQFGTNPRALVQHVLSDHIPLRAMMIRNRAFGSLRLFTWNVADNIVWEMLKVDQAKAFLQKLGGRF